MANRFPNKILTRFGMTKPIIQAPMTGYVTEEMVVAVSNAGGLGSLPATLLPPHAIGESIALLRKRTRGPIAVNFLAHSAVTSDIERDVARINFKMARILRTEVGNWKGVDDAFRILSSADATFLEKYEQELRRIGKELDDISGLLKRNEQREAWERYRTLRSSLLQDRVALRDEFARMDEAENYIRRLLT